MESSRIVPMLLVCLMPALSGSLPAADQNVVVVLDDSGSMAESMRRVRGTTKMGAARAALIEVLQQLPESAEVGVVLLNGRINNDPWVIPLGRVDQTDLVATMEQVQPMGGTPLGAFMKQGADALLEKRGQQHFGTYRLLIVTDGEANDPELVDGFLPDIMSRGLSVDVIGVDMASDHSLATRVNRYRSADDPSTLTRVISEVFAESADDDGDAAESDFELIQGLPDEIATAVVTTLTNVENGPIAMQVGVVQNAFPTGNASSSAAGSSPPAPTPPASKRGRSTSWIFYAVAFLIIMQMLKKFGRRK